MTASALYVGTVQHRRTAPALNQFRYRVFMVYLDLDEMPRLFDRLPGWSARRPALVRFRREDYFDGATTPLAEAVRDLVCDRIGRRPTGPVRLLTNPRIAGYVFNPISLYCILKSESEELDVLVLEVTNTPWGERCWYVLEGPQLDGARFPKEMHVSPFVEMGIDYRLSFDRPGDSLNLRLEVLEGDELVLDTSLTLARSPLNARTAVGQLLRHPLMTFRVTAAIHWQALKLWIKRVPFVPHPAKPEADR
ncbi:MAG: DUF1365 family protein [Actinobacteria bacterium]|uniref:Unannotated protein n=1 Tax=freshwater metagenome TaxID=449393 RepID=A0A6J5ZHC3_9ZZZZ|nr:DUF1365 family protein [Actinomycetota bacterium]